MKQTSRHLKIASVGEAMIELVMNADGTAAGVGFAGDTLNTAIYLRRALKADREVAFVSCIGEDVFSGRMAGFIEAQGISTASLRSIPDRLPGLYSITTDERGERSFLYWRDTSAARLLFDGGDFDVLSGFDLIYMSGITLAILPGSIRDGLFEWIGKLREDGLRFCFDSNYRPRLWTSVGDAREAIERAWRLADIALPSLDDEMALFGDASAEETLARFQGYGIAFGALKRGALGPLPLNGSADAGLRFPPAESVVDTTAAGDSFNAAFLAAHLEGASREEAMQAGHALASRVVAHKGAIIPEG